MELQLRTKALVEHQWPGFFPNTNSLTWIVKHWLNTCSLSGIIQFVCESYIQRGTGGSMHANEKVNIYRTCLKPSSVYKIEKWEYNLNSSGVCVGCFSYESSCSKRQFSDGFTSVFIILAIRADIYICLCVWGTVGISSGPCWTVIYEMPIAAHCICIRKLLFQFCVSAQFNSILELLNHPV